MRAPLCCDSTDINPEDQGIGSDCEHICEIQGIEKSQTKKTAIFGICLQNLMGTTPRVAPQIPFILSRLCRYIEEHGLHHKHLFLENEEKSLVESLKIEFLESGDAPLEVSGDVPSAAKLLIIFFEELPEPLIPVSAQPDFIEDMEKLSLNSLDCVSHLKHSLRKLPDSAYHVLKYLSRFLLHVASHKETNGMSSDSLSIIFGPVIFRLTSKDPVVLTSAKSVMKCFVQNYPAIFEDDHKNLIYEDAVQRPVNAASDGRRCSIPCPSTIAPVVQLMPLSVVIPDSKACTCSKSQDSVPILLIESNLDVLTKPFEEKSRSSDGFVKEIVDEAEVRPLKRNSLKQLKRKERRLSGEDTQPRSSSEERPAPNSLVCPEKLELMRRCSSHEEMKEGTMASDVKLEALLPTDIPKSEACTLDSFSSDPVVNEKNHSPHPPNAKRREVESNINQSSYYFMPPPWSNPNHYTPEKSSRMSDTFNFDIQQNSVVESEATMECDASECSQDFTDGESLCAHNKGDSQMTRIPRSASCPVPKAESSTTEEESNSLSMSWSMLFDDSEPVRSEHRYSWPLAKESPEDAALLSPSVQSLRKSNYYEAPLSPSAYKSYLSYRSHHLDSSVPPSPPVEQEDFVKNIGETSAVSDSIKKVTKKIHGIKKRIKKFDEKFEADFGYKPSHAEKTIHPDAKKLMNDLHKARKELKALKEEAHLEHVSPASWCVASHPHILEDTTNHPNGELKSKTKLVLEESLGTSIKCLADDRRLANRPESLDDMSSQQVKEEKFAIQKVLLQFESLHGKPCSRDEKQVFRPLYDRYRNVKRLLVRSGSFPGALNKKDICSELQPILEHETMDFTSSQHRTDIKIVEEVEPSVNSTSVSTPELSNSRISADDVKSTSSSSVSDVKYDNSNIHELPLSEMIFQLQQVRAQKRHLRKILKEFESEFCRLNGRKVQKEDKVPIDSLYGEYKYVKAKLKLLEALISKHDQHQLM